MPDFLVRPELHQATDYTKFHEAMMARGADRTLIRHDGAIFDLPTGEYIFRGLTDADDACKRTCAAASSIRKAVKMTIADVTHNVWFFGLERNYLLEFIKLGRAS